MLLGLHFQPRSLTLKRLFQLAGFGASSIRIPQLLLGINGRVFSGVQLGLGALKSQLAFLQRGQQCGICFGLSRRGQLFLLHDICVFFKDASAAFEFLFATLHTVRAFRQLYASLFQVRVGSGR